MGAESADFKCPMCGVPLVSAPGNQINALDGVTVFCENAECPCDEVFGHGNNEKSAYQIIKEKFKPRE
jgi:hypothetical protein